MESVLLFGLQAEETDADLTLFHPSSHGKIDTDGQVFGGWSEDQLQIAGRLDPGPGFNTTASGGQIDDDPFDPTARSKRKTARDSDWNPCVAARIGHSVVPVDTVLLITETRTWRFSQVGNPKAPADGSPPFDQPVEIS